MNEERRNVKINNSEYYVVGKDASRRVEAKVFDGENKAGSKNNSMLKVEQERIQSEEIDSRIEDIKETYNK